MDALERMKHCDDIRALAGELGVSRGVLYQWKEKAEHELRPENELVRTVQQLEAKVSSLEGELGRSRMDVSFFKSALRRVGELGQPQAKAGAMRSTKKSATGRRKAK